MVTKIRTKAANTSKEQVFAYLRVSDVSQAKDNRDGFPRQLAAIQTYCNANNMEVAGVFKEDISGTEEHRPIFASMMLSLESNGHGIKTVIIEKYSRLARKLMLQEVIFEDFRKKGFSIISATEGADTSCDDPTREAFRQMLGVFSQWEKSMIVLKLRAARDRKRLKTGHCEGRKGYRNVENLATLERIKDLRKKPRGGKRLTWQQIADELNSQNLTTIDGKPWSLHRVYQVFHNL